MEQRNEWMTHGYVLIRKKIITIIVNGYYVRKEKIDITSEQWTVASIPTSYYFRKNSQETK